MSHSSTAALCVHFRANFPRVFWPFSSWFAAQSKAERKARDMRKVRGPAIPGRLGLPKVPLMALGGLAGRSTHVAGHPLRSASETTRCRSQPSM